MSVRKIIIKLFLFMSILSLNVFAKDLGVIGQTYPIQEMDFLEFLQSQAREAESNGKLYQLQSTMQTSAKNYRDRPKSVAIESARKTRSWLVDPSIVLDHDIITPDGKILARAGTRINPLEHVPLTKTLIFYDADNEDEVKWVLELDKKLKGRDKLILVNGSVLSEEKRFKKTIYFDQEGRITKRFGAEHHPVTITQEGFSLRIQEVKL